MKLSESQFIWLTICVCSPCLHILEDLNEGFWILIHMTKYLSLVICLVDFSDFEWIFWFCIQLWSFWYFSVLLAVVKFLSSNCLNPPNCYTLDCIDCWCKFGQFSCTFPIKHTVWVCSHGICFCKSAGEIFDSGEHEKPAAQLV